ncbi:MAG: hypothetical protein LIR50_00925 [Bacillota bacterium]|nr:hypothetical protein [Bacillota bacterium]
MSKFLGKIHYWLYNKIQLHENLIEAVTELAENNGYDSRILINQSYMEYGKPLSGLLENEIDYDNIHGWLQQRIISVESRLAYIITELMKNNVVKKEDIADIFYESGRNAMGKLGFKDGSPENFFNLVFDYMLEGMPCDRVNEITEKSDTEIIWRTAEDLHKDYWDKVSGDINDFYYFRNSWINGFLSGSGFKYTRTENGINKIGRV